MNQINGLLMSGDLPVAIIKENQLNTPQRLPPYYFRRNRRSADMDQKPRD